MNIEQLATDAVVATFGRPATYTPVAGGDAIQTRAILDRDAELLGEYGQVIELHPVISLPMETIGRPRKNDRVDIDGEPETWLVDRVIDDDGYMSRSIVCAED